MNMRKMSGVSDYFVIASGTSTTHTRAIADHIAGVVKAKGSRVWRIEGESDASWVLLDCSDVVAHVFLVDTRRFYDLENLWKKAPKESFKDSVRPQPRLQAKLKVKPKTKSKPKLKSKSKAASRKGTRSAAKRRKKS